MTENNVNDSDKKKGELFYDVVNRDGWKKFSVLLKKDSSSSISGCGEEKNCYDSITKYCALDYPAPTCEAGNMYGRSKIVELDPRAYYNDDYDGEKPFFFPMKIGDEEKRWSAFRDDNLNKAIDCVRLFLKKTRIFYHCMVRAAVFDSFVKALEENGKDGRVEILPFSCWCDGARRKVGGGEERRTTILERKDYLPLYRHHRHFLITYKSLYDGSLFHRVFSKMETPYFDEYVYMKPIWYGLELVKTIGYLSNRKSRCGGADTFFEPPFEPNDDDYSYCTLGYPFDNDGNNSNHFCIFAPLPENFELPLVLQWEGGLTLWLDEIYGDSLLPLEFFKEAKSLEKSEEGRVWQIELKDLPDIRKVLVLPELKKNVWYCKDLQVLYEEKMWKDSFLLNESGIKDFLEDHLSFDIYSKIGMVDLKHLKGEIVEDYMKKLIPVLKDQAEKEVKNYVETMLVTFIKKT